jgi:hypothetical protein
MELSDFKLDAVGTVEEVGGVGGGGVQYHHVEILGQNWSVLSPGKRWASIFDPTPLVEYEFSCWRLEQWSVSLKAKDSWSEIGEGRRRVGGGGGEGGRMMYTTMKSVLKSPRGSPCSEITQNE